MSEYAGFFVILQPNTYKQEKQPQLCKSLELQPRRHILSKLAAGSRIRQRIRGHWWLSISIWVVADPRDFAVINFPIHPRSSVVSLFRLTAYFLGGLGDMLPADVLKKVNELLERVHRKDKDHQGSIVLNIYEKGSLHVDHVDNQNFYGDKWAKPQKEKGTYDASAMPASLCTEQAMALWRKVQQAGYVDEHYQPLISRTQSAILAFEMAKRLDIKEKWKVFETLWNRRNMYRDYYDGMNQDQTYLFLDKMKELFD